MNPMKRVGLAVLVVVGVALLGSTLAWAKPPKPAEPVMITLWPVGDEPQARGGAGFVVSRVVSEPLGLPGAYALIYSGKLTVTCAGLTQGATYSTPAGTFTADATGGGSVSAKKVSLGLTGYDGYWWPCIIEVVRLDSDGSRTTVLAGEFWG